MNVYDDELKKALIKSQNACFKKCQFIQGLLDDTKLSDESKINLEEEYVLTERMGDSILTFVSENFGYCV